MTERHSRLLLAALATGLSAAAVAIAFTPIPHTGGDNSGYVSLAHTLLSGGGYVEEFDPAGLPHTKYPPVFPALLALMIALGARTWAALKLSAAIPTVLATLFTCLWAQRRAGPLTGFAVAALYTLSAGVLYYSHWILSDPLFIACTMGALWALAMADRSLDGGPGSDGAGSDRAGADRKGPGQVGGGQTGAGQAAEERTGADRPGFDSLHLGWLALGVTLAGLAYFTRSAGLPLVLATLGWLGWSRRWRALGVSGAALGLPMFLWWLRGRGAGVAQYSTEFWMVNPYDPSLGTIGVGGLFGRIGENLGSYVFQHGPAGIVGGGFGPLSTLGVVLTVVAIVGWLAAARDRIGPAEIFFPLYAGLVLLWPAVWGGDRFALPLYPLVFLYGARALLLLRGRVPALVGQAIAVASLAALALPAANDLMRTSSEGRDCVAYAAQRGPWSCYGPRIEGFVEAAIWMRDGIPDGSAVLTRKPRHFHLLSSHPSRTFPFTDDPADHLALADEVGARYVLLDQWDGLAARNVGGAVRRQPGAFCFIRTFGDPVQGGAQLLGILPPEARRVGSSEGDVGVGPCPADYLSSSPPSAVSSSSDRIPLLDGLDS